MRPSQLIVRRFATVVGVIAVLAIGVGSIRAAAAWTAASAPLTVAPVTVAALEATIADERARSEALLAQMAALDGRSRDLQAALEAAGERIDADAVHADDVEGQLAAAKAKLAKLEKAIAKAKRDLKARQAAAAAPAVTVVSSRSDDDDDDEHEEHEDDDEDEDEDD